MKKLNITDKVPKGFVGELQILTKTDRSLKNVPQTASEFWLIKIKEPIKDDIAVYVFLFKLMEDQFKDEPELKMDKFWEIFETSMVVNWVEETEKQINELFWNKFTFKLI